MPAQNWLLNQPLTLKNNAVIKNRIMKSAMSEGLATWDNRMTDALVRLYDRWARGGTGLLISGNVMVDRRALGEPGNLVVEDDRDLDRLKQMTAAGTQDGAQFWMQINHPGKQAIRTLNKHAYAPSAIPFPGDMRLYFAPPQELTAEQIQDLITRFGNTAAIAKAAGFTGVQIHGAHGYLVSQFLSPRHNQRHDEWGGNPENRRRFVLALYHEMRRRVGPNFPIGIKLNSADFQRGGFTEDESLDVIRALDQAGIDLIEISGGTYEKPIMMLERFRKQKASTQARESFFLDFAEKARNVAQAPLVVTGGFQTPNGMNDAIASGAVDMVGLGRLLTIEPDASTRLLQGQASRYTVKSIRTGIKPLDNRALLELMWYGRQLRRLGNGQEPKPQESAYRSLAALLMEEGWGIFNTRLRA